MRDSANHIDLGVGKSEYKLDDKSTTCTLPTKIRICINVLNRALQSARIMLVAAKNKGTTNTVIERKNLVSIV